MGTLEPYQQLERDFGQWAEATNVVACSSGTAALHLALEALQLPHGSECIVPDFTMIATARAVTLAGLTPVFVDCTDSLLMAPEWLQKAVTERTRVILPVHVYGRISPMEAICRLANRLGLYVVEDCAEAHGATHPWLTVAKCYSFYKNKIIAGEEGGAVSFLHKTHAERAWQLRCLGFTPEHDFTHLPRGHNYRMSNAHARLILDSLACVRWNLLGRRMAESWYDELCPEGWRMPPRQAPWVYDLRIPGLMGELQGEVVRTLNGLGVQARHAFRPMHLQAEYAGCRRHGGENAERLSREVLYLPLSANISQETARLAFETIRRVVG